MRQVLVVSLLLAALLAGCGGDDDSGYSTLEAADIVLPALGSPVLETVNGTLAAVWKAIELPFVAEVTIPADATMVRAVADSGATSISISNLDTGRRRCNNAAIEDFTNAFAYPKSCSSITALDAPGAVWKVTFNAPLPANADTDPIRGDVRIEYLDVPYDGLLAGLDFSSVDKPTRDLEDTVVEFVPSHDGALLRTERTLPVGSGPFPAIIVSSPYYDDGIRLTPADWTYVVQDWAKRGYAMVTADVRGFGDSEGCVEVWGPNEQLDQKVLVEWVAAQPWSDGNVGFYGQSYVGTTPVEAAIQAPQALKAIVTVAPVINAYEDWHYGGVPNGESTGSPQAYQVQTDAFVSDPAILLDERFRNDPEQLLNNAKNGPCDPTLVARANDPRAVVDQFYTERNFKLGAKDVQAAVLYTQGFEDANVKSAMIPDWFNDLQSTKLGLFGHWLHQHPSRLDCEALMVGWFETHLKGKDLGFETLPEAAIVVDRETQRLATEWPPSGDNKVRLNFSADFTTGQLKPGNEGAGSADLALGSTGLPVPGRTEALTLTTALGQDASLAGTMQVAIVGVLNGPNSYVQADLYADDADGSRVLTWGRWNLAHNADHTQFNPNQPGDSIGFAIPLRPTEHLVRAGTTLRLVITGVPADPTDPMGALGASLQIDHLNLWLAGAPLETYSPLPLTARP